MSDLLNYYGSFEHAEELESKGDYLMAAVEYWFCTQYCEHGDFPFIPDLSLVGKSNMRLEKLQKKIPYAPLSKSTFIKGCQCLKALWLYKNKYQERTITERQQQRFDWGHKIGELAQQLFPSGSDASKFLDIDRSLHFLQCKTPLEVPPLPFRLKQNLWLQNTKDSMQKNIQNIYEAAFTYNDVFSAIDILHKEDNKYHAYEVKSSFNVKDVFIHDCALQYYVMSHNLKLDDFYIIHINEDYLGSLNIELKNVTLENCDINKLFVQKSILAEVLALQETIEKELKTIKSVLYTKSEPQMKMGLHCFRPYECDFRQYCKKQNCEAATLFDKLLQKVKALSDIKTYQFPRPRDILIICHI